MMAAMPELSRRAILRLGVGAAAGAAALRLSPPASAAPTYVDGSFISAARGGVTTNWAIARPPGQTAPLRPIIALHGKGQDAAGVMAGGVEQGLAQAVAAGIPPFAVVAVDGGGSYWHKRASGEDSGAMVLDELIPMLGRRASTPHASGFSAGRWAATAHCCSARASARRAPRRSARSARRCGRHPARRHRARSTAPTTTRPTASGACPRSTRFRSGSTAATAIRSIRRPTVHRPAGQPACGRLLPRRA